jgi:hypothetical protein
MVLRFGAIVAIDVNSGSGKNQLNRRSVIPPHFATS